MIHSPQEHTNRTPPNFLQQLFQLRLDIGQVTVELIKFPMYNWIILTNSHRLSIDGSLQLGIKTPYEQQPSVVDIGANQHQADSNDLCRSLTIQLQSIIILSSNLEIQMSISDRKNLVSTLKHKAKTMQLHEEARKHETIQKSENI